MGAAISALLGPTTGFLAALLAASALHKLAQRRRLAGLLGPLAGLAGWRAMAALAAAAGLELSLAAGLMFAPLRAVSALGAAVLWTGYLALVLRAQATKADCGCSFGAAKPAGAAQAVRTAGVALLAALLAVVARNAADAGVGGLDLLAGAGLLAVWIASDQVSGQARPRAA